MKKKLSFLLLFLIIQSVHFSFGQSIALKQHIKYKRVEIHNAQNYLDVLNQSGIDLTCGSVFKNNSITVELNEYQLNILNDYNIPFRVLKEDLEAFYSERAVADLPYARAQLAQMKTASNARSYSVNEAINNIGQYEGCSEIDWTVPLNFNLNPNSAPNSFGGCLTYDMVLQELDDMRAQYPNLISARQNASPSNQLTTEGRTIWAVRISDNPDTDEPSEPETLYQSLIHSRESASLMQMLYFMWYVLENYDSDTAIRNLVNNQELYFIPVFNPDGFVYNQTQSPNGGGLQRKNRNTSAPGSCSQFLDGIDLNRNSAYYWGNGGSSTNPCSDTYLGTAPFSENETQIMRDFFLQHDFKLALNHHSFKNAMLHAYAGTNITNPRPDEYSKYNHDMTYFNRYAHGPSTSISALNSGNMNDWMLGGPAGVSANGTPTGTGSGKNTLAWTPENGSGAEGGFWPAPSNFVPIAKRAMRMNFMAAYFSGKYAKLHDLNQTDVTTLTGDFNFAIENLGQTASDFTLTVTPVSSNITFTGGPVTVFGMSVLQQNEVAFSYQLNGAIQPNDEVEFKVVLTNDYASDNVLYEANIVKRYNPTVLFSDNPDTQNLSNWTASGGSWVVSGDAYSGSLAISSSNGTYSNNESKTLQLNQTLDLSSSTTAIIQFYAKWDLERSFDYVQLEGSTNGSNWTPLCGRLTKPGAPNVNNSYSQKSTTNNNFQPDGQPLYDGDTQDKWYMEEIVIDANNNSFLHNQSTVFLRFDFKTDGTNREDSYVNVDFEGFSFDEFKVTLIQTPCVATIPSGATTSDITEIDATINWDAIPSTLYDLRYREIGTTTWIDVNNLTTNSYIIDNLEVFTDYEAQVRSKCSNGTNSDYSPSINFTTLDIQFNIIYCDSNSTNVNDEFISNVQLNTIDNASGGQFYSDFTNISTNLTKGEQYTITITPTWTGTVFNEAYSVWIDYNRDGDFIDPGEQVWTQGITQATTVSGDFTIPSSATEIATRMRVSMKYNDIPDPCETFTYGEVEDYTVIIEPDAPDTTPPVITLTGSSVINLDVGSVYTEQGATAVDNIDGDLTANIVVAGDIVDTSAVGAYVVTYNVSDLAGNAAVEVARTVNVIPDTTPPVITLIGSLVIDLDIGSNYIDDGALAVDNIDGDLTANIVVAGDIVDTSVVGTYIVTYNVSDNAGNVAVEVTRTVNVIPDTIAPEIMLIGFSIINLSVGDTYTEQGATATDNVDGDITASIVITGTVNTAVAGNYTVNYNVSDAAGNEAAQVSRLINVNDMTGGNGCSGGVSSLPYGESFEADFGLWAQDSGDDLNWTRDSGGTPSNNTGPSNGSDGSVYVYVEASGNGTGFPNKRAIINSPCFDLSGQTEATFIFDYHMFGSTDGGRVDLEASTDDGGTWTSIWNQTGNQGNQWNTVSIDLAAYLGASVQLRFNRITGGTWQSDVALDNARVFAGSVGSGCIGGVTAPYGEGFESSIGLWTQAGGDDLNWTRDSGGTPSNNTGPSSGSSGSFYIYVEASGNGTGFPNKRAIINSPCLDLNSATSAIFSFDFHMFGSTDGGRIDLEVSDDNGITWTSIWNQTGNQGNQWNTVSINLSAYVGGGIQLRFNRITGGTWQSDVAIDNIAFSSSSESLRGPTPDEDGVSQNTTFKLSIYPNPVKGTYLNVSTFTDNLDYTIYNMLGQIVSKGKLATRIDVSELEAAVYMIEFSDGENKITKRFIKE